MAEKSCTVVIEVNSCSYCWKKIRKALCVLQERFTIASIAFDEKKNTIEVSGPFDPDCFIKKIRCLAGKVIKNIYIKPPPPPPPKPLPPKPLDVNLKILEWPCVEPCPSPEPCHKPKRCPSPEPCHKRCPSPEPCHKPRCSCGHCVEPCPSRRCSFNPECIKIVCENDPSDGCSIM